MEVRMNRLLLVCLFAITIATIALPAPAQTPVLRKGVSVQMPVTRNASSLPEADNSDAWIITVAANGHLYFGADPMTLDELADWMKTHPRNREARLYIKADARASFGSVEQALELARTMAFEAPVLLTKQPEHNPPGTMVPPKGEDVLVDTPTKESSIVVQISRGESSSTLSVNNQEVSPKALKDALMKSIQNGGDRVVVVKTDGTVPFGDFTYVVDVSRSVGASVAVLTAQL
jgi:biopolymer transport protein ExbD